MCNSVCVCGGGLAVETEKVSVPKLGILMDWIGFGASSGH